MADRQAQIMHAAVHVIAQDGVRGLRIDKLAKAARVSPALIYYHFKDRDGVLRAALEHINHRAQAYTEPTTGSLDARSRLEQMLLQELQDTDDVRANSIAWGELRASAVFDGDLRESLRETTTAWSSDAEALIRSIPTRSGIDAEAAAQRLTALVEGLSERWHSGSIALDDARRLLRGGIAVELGD